MPLPSLTGVSIDRLKSFLLVAEAGGHARAAPGDPVRQSQLSRQVSELEVALAQELFVRSGRGMSLTPAGDALARVVRELGRGIDDVTKADAGPVKVRLGAGDSVLQWLVLPKLVALAPALDGIELEVTAADSDGVVEGLLASRLDLGVLRQREAAPDLKSFHLGRVSYALFGATGKPGLPLAIATSERGITATLARLGPPALRCETFPQVAQAVRTGRYAGVLPTFARSALPTPQFTLTSVPTLESAASPLTLSWRARTLELRPRAVKRLHSALKAALRVPM